MNTLQTLQEFLTTQSPQVAVSGFVLNLLLCAVLAFFLGRIYMKYGHALSNRRLFARNFILIAMTTMLVIAVVKSSLALSLGLVGALSIVRFRTAIKEPEELAYLFLTIAIGLGLGADQRVITVVAFAIISATVWLRSFSDKLEKNQNLYLTISSDNPHQVDLKAIVEVLQTHCSQVNLKRFDTTRELIEASFLVEFEDFEQLENTRSSLGQLGESVSMTFLDSKGIGDR